MIKLMDESGKLIVTKRRLIVASYVTFMMAITLPTIFNALQWNITAGETFLHKEKKFIYNFMAYILVPLIVMAYLYFVYVTTASLRFYLKYKDFGAKCYYFHKDRLYIHSKFSPIPVEKIEYMKIVRHVYRGEYFVILIKIKNRMLKHKFRLGIGGFIRGDNSVLLKKLIDDLNKRDIPYTMK